MGTSDGGQSGDDLSSVQDMTMICTPGAKTCTGSTLSTCTFDGTDYITTTCTLGCNMTDTDCLAVQPTPPAMPSDFVYGGLSDLTIAATQTLLIFDTDTGAITDNTGATVRMPNPSGGTRAVENGIGFHQMNGVGIWTFSNFSLPVTALMVFKNPSAASILSPGNISIAGTIDLRGYADPAQARMTTSTLCVGPVAGPGGTKGGMGVTDMGNTAATGAGAGGQPDNPTAGAGGGGHGDVGGTGGKNGGVKGGTSGAMTGTAAINPLAGGFGGGSSGGNGGGGGGALQLAAEGTITISGTINAGGCGGAAGDANNGGGGGGSGGAILIEALTVNVTATAHLAANGGGGGAGGSATSTGGDPGGSTTSPANGGAGLNGGHNGGSGGAQGMAAGNGLAGPGASGGGGAVGYVRLNGKSAPTIDGAATISPTQTTGVVVVQ